MVYSLKKQNFWKTYLTNIFKHILILNISKFCNSCTAFVGARAIPVKLLGHPVGDIKSFCYIISWARAHWSNIESEH